MHVDAEIVARFWAKVDRSGDCWIWTANRLPRGYGRLTVRSRPELAHRMSWRLAHGPIPDGLQVLHRCDNPPCVNPAHLWLGTNLDNRMDSVAKGRTAGGVLAGPINPSARLTAADVDAMRARRSEGATYVQMASELSFSAAHIWRILNGRAWIPAA